MQRENLLENISKHLDATLIPKDKYLNLLENSLDICCPQNQIRLISKENKLIIIRNATKDLQKNSLEYFYLEKDKHIVNKKTKSATFWDKNDIKFLENNLNLPIKKLSIELSKSEYQINCMISKLKLYIKKKWTINDDLYLKDNYLNKTDLEISNNLNRSLASIKSRRRKLGLIDREK